MNTIICLAVCLSVCHSVSLSVFNPKLRGKKSHKKTLLSQAGARLLNGGVQTVHHVNMCTVLFSLAQPKNEKKAQALPEIFSQFRYFILLI